MPHSDLLCRTLQSFRILIDSVSRERLSAAGGDHAAYDPNHNGWELRIVFALYPRPEERGFTARWINWHSGFPSAPALRSSDSAGSFDPLFAVLITTMARSDFSNSFIIGFEFPLHSSAAPPD